MKKILLFLLCALILMPLKAKAQEGPTVGAACTTAGVMARVGGPEITSPSGGNWIICNGSTWVETWNFGRNAKSSIQVDYDSGTCTTAKTGRIRYHSVANQWSFCNGTIWALMARDGESCNIWDKAPGYVCPDGSVFAGFLPDANNTPLFTTRCDAGQTWNGSACTGTRTTMQWGGNVTQGATDLMRGDLNTAKLSPKWDGITNAAAEYCVGLTMHGRNDWYLPALGEFAMMNANKASISGFGVTYRTSNEWSASDAVLWESSSNANYNSIKTSSWNVRCARRGL